MSATTSRAGRISLAIVSAAALVLVACGAPPTAGPAGGAAETSGPTAAEKLYAEIGALSGQQRRERLVELAKKEGELNLYTSMTADAADALTEAFAEQFDIDVNVYRASGEAVLQRVLQEQAAGYGGNDVVETNTAEMVVLNAEGLFADYRGERRDLVPEVGRFEGWTATRFNLFGVSWNTNLVPAGQQPTSWEDLADPKWDGKLSMEAGDFDWYLTLYNHWLENGKSPEEVDRLFGAMADGAKTVKGHTVQAELMSAGEFAVAASNYTYIVERAKTAGAPVDYVPYVEPVIARPNGAGLMKTAQHPAAAMLFVDWVLEEGQQILADEESTPAITEGADPLAGVEVIPVDVERLLDESKRWSTAYDDLLRAAEQSSGG